MDGGHAREYQREGGAFRFGRRNVNRKKRKVGQSITRGWRRKRERERGGESGWTGEPRPASNPWVHSESCVKAKSARAAPLCRCPRFCIHSRPINIPFSSIIQLHADSSSTGSFWESARSFERRVKEGEKRTSYARRREKKRCEYSQRTLLLSCSTIHTPRWFLPRRFTLPPTFPHIHYLLSLLILFRLLFFPSRGEPCVTRVRAHTNTRASKFFLSSFSVCRFQCFLLPLFRVQSGPRSTAYRLRTNNPRNGTQAYLSAPDSYPSDT